MLSDDPRFRDNWEPVSLDLEKATVVRRADLEKIDLVIRSLRHQVGAEAVFLASRSGQPIAVSGDVQTEDTQSLASLGAGVVAAVGSLAPLLNERFLGLDCIGAIRDLRLAPVGDEAVLMVTFRGGLPPADEAHMRSALMILGDILKKARKQTPRAPEPCRACPPDKDGR